MTERDPGWKASVDGVVSDFDHVTRHLRRRQGQALRVAWSVVGATALAMGALIGMDLLPSGQGAGQIASPSIAQVPPGSSSTPNPSPLGGLLPALPTFFASPAPAASPSAPVTTPAPGTTQAHRRLTQVVAPVLAAVPVSPRGVLAPVTGSPSESAQPAPSSPSPSGGLLDGLVRGVIHGTG